MMQPGAVMPYSPYSLAEKMRAAQEELAAAQAKFAEEMMAKRKRAAFKPGDTVRCTKVPKHWPNFTVGVAYPVELYGKQMEVVVKDNNNQAYLINATSELGSCFELATPEPKAEPVTNSFWSE
jgi:hypothetical protein